jgi:hypothetical protein
MLETLAGSQALTDNFIKFRISNDEQVDDLSLRDLHKLIIEEMLYGYDVLPSAVHLTASTLALLAPETCFQKMHLYSLPMGKMQSGQIYLGSIDYISSDTTNQFANERGRQLRRPTLGGQTPDESRARAN